MISLASVVHDALALAATIAMLVAAGAAEGAGVLYANPGWAYAYEGDQAYYNDPDGPNPDYLNGDATNLPGGRGNTAALEFPGLLDPDCDPSTTVCEVDNENATWIHSGSQWDGSAPGDPLGGTPGDPVPIPPAAPGGVGTYTVDGVSYLRIQDAGDPQGWGWADKNAQANSNSARQEGSNRRIQFAHKIERDTAYSGNAAVIDNGITIAFRTRLATPATGPLDPFLHEDGPPSGPPLPWPSDGKGYPVANNGRGMFMVTQTGTSGGGQIAFSLLDENTIDDQGLSIDRTGLVFNNKSGGPDTNDATANTLNIVEIENNLLSEWQEFWITIQQLAAPVEGSTHAVTVYHNGSLIPQTFQVVLGNQNEFGTGPHLGLGLSSGTRWGAYDIDFFAYKEGVVLPQLASTLLAGDYNDNGIVDAADYTVWRDSLGASTALPNETETLGSVTIEDYDAWKTNFGATAGSGAATFAQVPEPGSLLLGLSGLLVLGSLNRSRRGRASPRARAICLIAVTGCAVWTCGARTSSAAETHAAQTAHSLQEKLDEAAPHGIVDFRHTELVTIDTPLRVTKPVWIRSLRVRLPPELPRAPLLIADVKGVRITDCHFCGNGDSVSQGERASLVEIRAGQFSVERCIFENAAKNGLTIDPSNSGKHLVGGVVRDIVGRNVVRDVVSLSGGAGGVLVRDVLVENVHASDSSMRGAVEVSDGSWDIAVRGVTAERCVYAVDVQDHEPGDVNHNVLLEDIRARHCRHAIRTATDPFGHEGLIIRNVVAESCDVPIRISYIKDVVVDGVRIVGRQKDPAETDDLECLVQIKQCANVVLRDVSIFDAGELPTAVRVIDTEQLRVDGLIVSGKTSVDSAIVHYLTSEKINRSKGDPSLRNITSPTARRGKIVVAVGRRQTAAPKVEASSDSAQTPEHETQDATSSDKPKQYAPQDAYLPGDPLPFYGSEDPWYRTKQPSPGGRLYQTQQVLDLIQRKTRKALADSQKWIDEAQTDDSDEARFYCVVALAQLEDWAAAERALDELLNLGFPPERFLAGPRELTQPLEHLEVFQRRVVAPARGLVHGPLLGAVTAEGARIWVRTAHAAEVEVVVYQAWDPDHVVATGQTETASTADYTGVAIIGGLAPETEYQYRLRIDGREVPRWTEWAFRTAPADDSDAKVSVAFGGCANYTPANERIWDTIRLRQPDAFVTLGDNVYIDLPGPVTAWHDQAYYRRQSRPEWRRLTASTPIYSIWDDHDVAVDDVFLGPYVDRPSWKLDQFQLFRRQWNNPSYGAEPKTPGVWSGFRRGKVEFFLLDGRFYRENFLRPNASMLGPVQKAWLLNALKNSTATFKVIVSPVAWADDAKTAATGGIAHDTWAGYQSEREELFDFINTNQIDGVLLLAGDRHRSDIRIHQRKTGYPLYEFESARLTNDGFHEPHGETLFVYTAKQSFGFLTFEFHPTDPTATIEIVNIDGRSVYNRVIPLSEISHKPAGKDR